MLEILLMFKFPSLHFNSSCFLLMQVFIYKICNKLWVSNNFLPCFSVGFFLFVCFGFGGAFFFVCWNSTFSGNIKHSKCFVTSSRRYVSLGCSVYNAGSLPYSLLWIMEVSWLVFINHLALKHWFVFIYNVNFTKAPEHPLVTHI